MGFKSNLRLSRVNQGQEVAPEVRMGDQIRKYWDVCLRNQGQTINKKLKFFNVQVMDILLASELKLFKVLLLRVLSTELIIEKTEVSHHLK